MTVQTSQPAAEPRKPPLYNPLLPEFISNPHPFYHRLRAEEPVHWSSPYWAWVLTGYDDVVGALKDERFSAELRHWEHRDTYFGNKPGVTNPILETFSHWMLQLDPPDHTRLRALHNKAFTPRVVEKMRPTIQGLVDELLDKVDGRDEMDYIAELTYPLPILVISEMLGVPREDYDKIKHWSAQMIPMLSPSPGARVRDKAKQEIEAFREYCHALVDRHRREPGDRLISGLVAAFDQGDRLTTDELIATCILLVFAGHYTTVQLLSNMMIALLTHPDQRKLLEKKPELIDNAVEETLRWESPLQLVYRYTKEDVTIRGTTIPKGKMVHVSLVAANRDPSQFPDPDTYIITRPENRHVAFGYGIHYCAGAPLARLEAEIAAISVLRRFPNIRLKEATLRRESSLTFRSLLNLPVSL